MCLSYTRLIWSFKYLTLKETVSLTSVLDTYNSIPAYQFIHVLHICSNTQLTVIHLFRKHSLSSEVLFRQQCSYLICLFHTWEHHEACVNVKAFMGQWVTTGACDSARTASADWSWTSCETRKHSQLFAWCKTAGFALHVCGGMPQLLTLHMHIFSLHLPMPINIELETQRSSALLSLLHRTLGLHKYATANWFTPVLFLW